MVMSHQMPAAFFLLCVALATAPGVTWAEVVKDFEKCKKFFYMGTEPTGFDNNSTVKICQRYNNSYYYATLYSTEHRIPLYSAYILDLHCSDHTKRCRSWFIEPQISFASKSPNMRELKELEMKEAENIEKYQAVNKDYIFSGMERGQLRPSSYQRSQTDLSTYTLTNAVPMDPAFSNVYWKFWQDNLKSNLKLYARKGTTYVITGAMPSCDEIPVPHSTVNHTRVNVPHRIWTAVCFRHHSQCNKSFSFAYVGRNMQYNNIRAMTIRELNAMLSHDRKVNVFFELCTGCAELSEHLIEKLTAESIEFESANLDDLIRFKLKSAFSLKEVSLRENVYAKTFPQIKEVFLDLAVSTKVDGQRKWFEKLEDMKKTCLTACVLKHNGWSWRETIRDVDVTSSDFAVFACEIVPEKSSNGSTITADGTPCNAGHVCNYYCPTAKGNKKCCTSPCLFDERVHSFMCQNGKESIHCSPQYLSITHDGHHCRRDHPCATYGHNYYWCKKEQAGWGYCSSPYLRGKTKGGNRCSAYHACGTYGESYHWCYLNNSKKWDYCCLSDGPYSALNGKTCRPNHPCDYYNKDYLWCYTTNGCWDYCCSKN